jgi:hypothetical protein
MLTTVTVPQPLFSTNFFQKPQIQLQISLFKLNLFFDETPTIRVDTGKWNRKDTKNENPIA